MVKPKKHLGQHFLTDQSIAKRIADALLTEPGATVFEVGPGKGILTQYLLEKKIQLLPVEIDPESSAYLKQQWPELQKLLLEEDFLKLDLQKHAGDAFHVIGNFPYNISSQIFFRILENRDQVSSVVCMLQKEVAERISSPPGSKTYGILSVFLQAYYDIRFLFSVKPGSFFPAPKVTSGVIRLTRNGTFALPCDEALFFRVVKTTFNQRRKMIRNSLKSILVHLDSDSELLSKRPEQLGVSDFVKLTNWVETRLKES